jgi:hypothetical protein
MAFGQSHVCDLFSCEGSGCFPNRCSIDTLFKDLEEKLPEDSLSSAQKPGPKGKIKADLFGWDIYHPSTP